MNDTTLVNELPPPPSRLDHVVSAFGSEIVCVAVQHGAKNAIEKGFQKFTLEDMQKPERIELLNRSNIAVLAGRASGDIISIDFDDESALSEFLAINPNIVDTVKSEGSRGCNLWFKIDGDYPGRMVRLSKNGDAVGEWRGGACYTIVSGRHPDGVDYIIDRTHLLKTIAFSDINWPEDWDTTWSEANSDESEDTWASITDEYGPPYIEGKNGGLTINEMFVARIIEVENLLLYDTGSQNFFTYSEDSGLWVVLTSEEVEKLIACYFRRISKALGQPGLLLKQRQMVISSIKKQLAASVATALLDQQFAPQWKYFTADNGVVATVPPGVTCRFDFNASQFLTRKSKIPFQQFAECHRFLKDVIEPVLTPDDALLLQKVCGLILVGPNDLQKIILFEGHGLSSKGVVQTVIDELVGPQSVIQLRTDQLASRFETSRFLNKRLLAGRDVPSDFLKSKAAFHLKSLTGGDLLNGERKNSNEEYPFYGNLHALITSNTPLALRVDSDGFAWARRLVIIPFQRKGPSPKRILKLADKLLETEGSGILNWFLQGALTALAEIETHGDILLTSEQAERVKHRVEASDSIAHFVRERVESGSAGITSKQLHAEYNIFCEENGLFAEADRTFHLKCKAELLSRFDAKCSENITWNNTRGRGYRGVQMKSKL